MVLRTCRKLLAARRKFLALRPRATSFSSITRTTSSAIHRATTGGVTKTVFALATYNYASLPFYRRLLRRRRSCKSASRHPRFYRVAKNFTVRSPLAFVYALMSLSSLLRDHADRRVALITFTCARYYN